MIRLAAPADKTALLSVSESIDLFGPDELEEMKGMISAHFDGEGEHGAFWLVSEDNHNVVGCAYCAPERMTNGTWNLLFIGIRPEHQGKGFGRAIVSHIEGMLAEKGAHLLLVETLTDFERTRTFYHRCGYEKEAQIRDFYDVGAHKVIYRKRITAKR